MFTPSLLALGSLSPKNRSVKVPNPLKCGKSSITQPWINQFHLNFVQSLHTWHPKFHKSSRSRGQRSRLQRDITCAKIRKIINNVARDCSISLEFRTDFDHVALDVPQTFKVNGSKVNVTAWHNVSAQKRYIIQARISSKVKLGENIPRQSATRYTLFKVIMSNIELAITLPQIARLRSNLVHSFTTCLLYTSDAADE